MNPDIERVNSLIREKFRLDALPGLADLKTLAQNWGVTSIEEREIGSEAMLLPHREGYSIVLKTVDRPSRARRQRFSFAHELGHLLLQKSQQEMLRGNDRVPLKYRGHGHSNPAEERLCDQIAAEILMPRLAFQEDAWMDGWSLRNLLNLARKYDTSVAATAIRMIDLMPEEALMGVWKLGGNGSFSLKWSHTGKTAYRVPGGSLSNKRLGLVAAAWHSGQVESGAAPVVPDSRSGGINLREVPAEALAWGQGEYRQAFAYYYPGRV